MIYGVAVKPKAMVIGGVLLAAALGRGRNMLTPTTLTALVRGDHVGAAI